MKPKTKKGIKLFFTTFLCAFLCGLSYFTICAISENSQIQKEIRNFKDKATFYQYSPYYATNFYKVENTYTYDTISPSFTIVNNRVYAGYNGDIFTSLRNELGIEPISTLFSYYFGGHAALVYHGDQIFHTTGMNPDGDNYAFHMTNNWLRDHTLRYNFIGLKVNTTQENRDKAMEYTNELEGKLYNYAFIVDTKDKYYCSDLVSRTYAHETDIDLNSDRIVTTVQDLIVADSTYMFMYKEPNSIAYENREENKKGDYNLYYLDDGINYDFR